MRFRDVLTKLLAAFVILCGAAFAGSLGWALAQAVGDQGAARGLGWLALALLLFAGLIGAALLVTVTLWLLAQSTETPAPDASAAKKPADDSSNRQL